MQNSKLVLRSLVHSIGVLIYVSLVAWIMQNGERIFGKMDQTIIAPITFLLLFVLSASIVGSLVFGRPALMYFNGQKREALEMFFYTIGWLAVIFVIVFAVLATRS